MLLPHPNHHPDFQSLLIPAVPVTPCSSGIADFPPSCPWLDRCVHGSLTRAKAFIVSCLHRIVSPCTFVKHGGHGIDSRPHGLADRVCVRWAQHFPGKRHCDVPSGLDYLRLTPVEDLK